MDNDGISKITDVTAKATLEKFEQVTVKAGSFRNCLKVTTSVQYSVHLSSVKRKIRIQLSLLDWFASGVGRVKRSATAKIYDWSDKLLETQQYASNLTGYVVGGKSRGMVHYTLAQDFSEGGSDLSVPGRPAIASNGQNFLFVQQQEVGTEAAVTKAILLSPRGVSLKSVTISSRPLSWESSPAVASDGKGFLMVTQDDGNILGTRVSSSGDLLVPGGRFKISRGIGSGTVNSQPAVAFDGANYLVLYNHEVDEGEIIFGALVSPAGKVLRSFPVSTPPGYANAPFVVFDGTNSFAVWTYSRGTGGARLRGARIKPDGTVLDAEGIDISTAPGFKGNPHIAFDDDNYFVAWADGRNPSSGNRVYGARITREGVLLDGPPGSGGILINNSPGSEKGNPTVSFDGTSYLVVWDNHLYGNDPLSGIYGTKVSQSGALVEGTPREPGMRLSWPTPCNACKPTAPYVVYNGDGYLFFWVNNSEYSGMTKDVLGAFLSKQ